MMLMIMIRNQFRHHHRVPGERLSQTRDTATGDSGKMDSLPITKEAQTLLKYLRSLKFFDVLNQEERILSEETRPVPPVGKAALPSNQGDEPICSSHALGKCVVISLMVLVLTAIRMRSLKD